MKLLRKFQKIFCDAVSEVDNISQFGSLKADDPNFSKDPDVIQALPAFGQGWKGAARNNNAPALQDENSLFYLLTRQLAYLFQAGIPEWNSQTEYHVGSFCQSNGLIYRSITNDNQNNSVSSTDDWEQIPTSLQYIASKKYALNDVVFVANGDAFISLENSNHNNNPVTSADKWKPIVQNSVSLNAFISGLYSIDCQIANHFETYANSNCVCDLINMREGQTVTVVIGGMGSPAYTITWKNANVADIKWNNAVVPTPTTTSGRFDRYIFQKIGGRVYGSADMNCY